MIRARSSGPEAAHLRVMELLPHEPNPLNGSWKRRDRPLRSTTSRGWCPLVALNRVIRKSAADPVLQAAAKMFGAAKVQGLDTCRAI